MPRTNLTAAAVERLKAPAVGQVEYYDQRLPGFGLRLSYKGARSWFVMTRVDGKLVRLTLGKYPALPLAHARDQARRAVLIVEAGQDPRRVRNEAEEQSRTAKKNTFGTAASEFLAKHAEVRLRPSTQREYRRVLTGRDTHAWQARPVGSITKRDVLEVLARIDERGSPGAAKRSLVYLRKFFSWCAERDLVQASPTDRIRAPHPEVKRDRVLSEDELRWVVKAVHDDRTVFGGLIRVLLLTGQRRAEVAGMRWSELELLPADCAVWRIPGARTKNKQGHLVPLTEPLQQIIARLPKAGDFLFSTTGETPVSGFGRAKLRLDSQIAAARRKEVLSPLPGWTFHDLRRTMVTIMNEKLGVAPHVVEAVVNHMSGSAKAGVAGVYNRALYLAERRRALSLWADYVSELR